MYQLIWTSCILYTANTNWGSFDFLYLLIIFMLLTALTLVIAKLRKLKQENIQLTLYSKQTSLPNKSFLLQSVEKSPALFPIQNMTLLYIDIDDFKSINELKGFDFSDLLLSKVGERLTALSKPKGQVYHMNQDEFVVLFTNTPRKGIGEIMAINILAGFKDSFEIAGNLIYLNLSIGIVDHPSSNDNMQQVITAAEAAMYHAKQTGKDRYVVFNLSLRQAIKNETRIQNHLRQAIEQDEFEIYYQPQLDLAFDRIDGFEALLRWTSREMGSIPPDQFIKVAETTHLIVPLGNWVLRKACAFLKKLEKMGYGPLNMSINVSVVQLMQADFVSAVQETLNFLDLAPEHLELEITESILIETLQLVRPKLEQLRDFGVRIALDDFGTGYSSFGYLSQIPITTLKLDKSFTDKIGTNQEGLMESLLYLCKRLELSTVAEGVEKNHQLSYLKEKECEKMQGFLFSKPLPEQGIIDLLKSAPTLFDEPYPQQVRATNQRKDKKV